MVVFFLNAVLSAAADLKCPRVSSEITSLFSHSTRYNSKQLCGKIIIIIVFYLLQYRILKNSNSILPDYCWKGTHHEGILFSWLFYYILLQSAMRKRRGIIFLMLLQYINITYKAAKVELARDQR